MCICDYIYIYVYSYGDLSKCGVQFLSCDREISSPINFKLVSSDKSTECNLIIIKLNLFIYYIYLKKEETTCQI
jgi:hypothetical protein